MLVKAMENLSNNPFDFACKENCAEAVKIAVNLCNLKHKEIFTNSCTQTMNYLSQSKFYRAVSLDDAQRNDIIFFDWDNSHDADHVGVIVEKKGNLIKYVDFNGSNRRKRGYGYIRTDVLVDTRTVRAIFRYNDTLQETKKTYTEVDMPLIRRGMKGAIVKLIQAIIGSTTDGMFGENTEQAVKEYQRKNNCEVDGIVGDETLTAMSHDVF